MTVKVFIDNMQVSLFEDEGISLTSSVLDIEDITKNTTDYSKTFTVPANENNNWIFKHYYNANIDNYFDARVTVDGRIELDNFIFRTGKFILRSVNIKQGVASSYTINFWGNLVSLKELLGDDLLSDLDLSAYDHNYTDSIVRTGLVTEVAGMNGDLVYTPMAKKQYYYESGISDDANDTSANIAYNGATGGNGINWNELKPSLKIIRILEVIESKYDITFSRQFFGTTTFTSLFMWLNNDSELNEMGGRETDITFTSGNSPWIGSLGTYPSDYFDYPMDDANDVSWNLNLTVIPQSGYEEVPYTIRCRNASQGGGLISEKTVSGTGSLKALIEPFGYPVAQTFWSIECSQEFSLTAYVDEARFIGHSFDDSWTSDASVQGIDSYFETRKNIPEMLAIDFLKGLFQAFKLVIIPLRDGTIYVNTLKAYYSEGELLDLTRYIDTNQITVERGNVLSNINYNFQEPTTILNQTFEQNNNVAYGDEELVLKNSNNQLLQGDTVSVQLPFETVLFERLYDLNDATETNVQYGNITDTDLKPVNPKAVVHYVLNESMATKSVAFVNEDDSKTELNVSMNIPSSSGIVSGIQQPGDVFLFSVEFSPWDSQAMNNTLYSKYHSDYISDIFNPKRRNYTVKAILPLRVLLAITLNDAVRVREQYYRIDNFTINTLTGEAQIKLFNSLNISVYSFSATPTEIELSKDAQTYVGYVINLIPYTYQIIDVGYGVDWITVSDNDVTSSIEFTVTENIGATRIVEVKLIKTGTLEEILFTITQAVNDISPTVDSTIITVDNTQITI